MLAGYVIPVAQAIAAAEHGIPNGGARGQGLWPSLGSDDQARYQVLAQTAVETYLTWIADRRTV